MSLTQAVRSSLSGINLAQQKIAVTSNNIANVNTEGYTRKVIKSSPQQIGSTGLGVRKEFIERQVLENSVKKIRESQTSFGAVQDLRLAFADLQGFIGSPRSGYNFSSNYNKMLTSMESLKVNPSYEVRESFVTDAKNFTESLNGLGNKLQEKRLEIDTEISTLVEKANTILQKLEDLNKSIGALAGDRDNIGHILDQRDQQLRELSEIVDIQVFTSQDGTVAVQTQSGKSLLGTQAFKLTHDPASVIGFNDVFDAASPSTGLIQGIYVGTPSDANDITSQLRGGRLKGLVELRDKHLPQLAADLEKFAYTVKEKINEAHNAGSSHAPSKSLDGQRFFADILASDITLSGTTRVARVDGDGNFTNYVDIPPGTYSLNDISTFISTTGIVTDMSDNSMNLSHATDGIAIVDLGDQTITHDGETTKGLSHFLGLNDFFVDQTNKSDASTISQTISIREDILNNSMLLSNGKLSTETSPSAGDKALPEEGDTDAISELAEAMNGQYDIPQALTYKTRAGTGFSRTLNGTIPTMKTKLSSFSASFIAKTAEQATEFEQRTKSFETQLQIAVDKFQSESGVNIDEEFAELIVIQQSFAASGRMIGVTSELFDILNNMV